MNSYDKTWGRVKSITYPALGNHEYQTAGADGLLRLLQRRGQRHRPGRRPQQGLLQLRHRHLAPDRAQLERHCTIVSCGAGLRAGDVAEGRPRRHPNYCTLAYWHHPRFNSGHGGNLTAMAAAAPGPLQRRRRRGPRRPRPRLRALRAAEPERRSSTTRAASASSWSAPAAPSSPSIGIAEAEQPGAPEHHLRRAEADAAPDQLRLAVRARGGQDVHRLRHRHLPRRRTRRRPTRPSRRAPGNLTATAGTGQVALNWKAVDRQRGRHRLPGLPRHGTQVATARRHDHLHGHEPRARPLQLHGEGGRRGREPLRPEHAASATVRRHDQADRARHPRPRPPAPARSRSAGRPSTDNVGVTGYRVFRGTTADRDASAGRRPRTPTPASPPAPTATPCAPSTRPATSPTRATRATATVPDTTKPTAPGNLTATARHRARSRSAGRPRPTTWASPATGSSAAADADRDPRRGTTSYTDTGLAPGPYSYTVKAVDAAGNLSDPSNTRERDRARHDQADRPAQPDRDRRTGRQVDLSWQASTDNVGVTGYQVYRGRHADRDRRPRRPPTRTPCLAARRPTRYKVRALDAAGNLSDPSNTATVTLLRPTTSSPTAPAQPHGDAERRSTVDLTWNASTRQRGRDRLHDLPRRRACSTASAATTSYSDTSPAGGRPRLHGARRRRGRQPLRSEQHRDRDGARHREADRARQPRARPQQLEPGRPELGRRDATTSA